MLFDTGSPVKQGDIVDGALEVLRNLYWRRHFNYDVEFRVNDGEQRAKSFGLWRYKTVQAPKPESVPTNAI